MLKRAGVSAAFRPQSLTLGWHMLKTSELLAKNEGTQKNAKVSAKMQRTAFVAVEGREAQ